MAADPLTKSTVDDLFNTDFSDLDDDPFNDKPATHKARDDKAVLSPRAGAKRKAGDNDKENGGLGLDDEVKIVKKRKPVAKLDEARLLSEPGIPKLRSTMRAGRLSRKLRLKGKGHEFPDAARLLNHFQLWLDNLYPRAKFADALQMVEKAGHTKRMHLIRNEWINEGKPGYRRYEDIPQEHTHEKEPDLFETDQATSDTVVGPPAEKVAQPTDSLFGAGLDDDALFIPDANRPSRLDDDGLPDDDELDLLLAENSGSAPPRKETRQDQQEDSEGEDDLDALLAEQEAQQRSLSSTLRPNPIRESVVNEEDDLDALLAEQEVREAGTVDIIATSTLADLGDPGEQEDIEDDDEDDLEAMLAMQRSKSKRTADEPEPSLPTPQLTSSPVKTTSNTPLPSDIENTYNVTATTLSSSPVPNNPEDVDLDDLEALLASQEERLKQKDQDTTSNTPRGRKFREAENRLFSSSPIPNRDSQ